MAANRLAHHLAAHGVGTGSHVGMCTRNRLPAIVTMLAVYKLRAVLINVNFRYTATEIRYVLDNADVVALVHERLFSDRVAEALPGAPSVRHTVVVEDGSDRPFAGTAYATSKAALAALTREMASDFGPLGIRVNAIAPGEIDTAILSPGTEKIVAQIPLRRLGTTDEVAKIIYVLCTDTSSYVTGAEIHINGGQHV